jgi:hypothetical protein
MRCEVCGNDYDMPMAIYLRGKTGIFDCFECAIHAMAPRCSNCGCAVIGHGVEAGGRIFCCASCAHAVGARCVQA